MDDVELQQIVKGCVSQDRNSQEKLYNFLYRKMFAVVKTYIYDSFKAEEIVNNGFLRIFNKIHSYNGLSTASLYSWCRIIMYRSVCDYIKSEKKKVGNIYVDDDCVLDKFSKTKCDNNGYNDLLFKDLLKEVNSLPEATKNVFHLYTFEGYTHVEIAKMVGISEGTSKWHLSEAKSILRKKVTLKNISW